MYNFEDDETIDNSWMTPKATDTPADDDTTEYATPVVEATPIVEETTIPEEITAVEEISAGPTTTTDVYVEQGDTQGYDDTSVTYESSTTTDVDPEAPPTVDNNLSNYYNNGTDDFSFEDPIEPKTAKDYKIWFILGGAAVFLLLLFYLPKMFSGDGKGGNSNAIPLLPDIVGARELLEEKSEEFDSLRMTRYIYTGMENGKKDAIDYWDALEKKHDFKMRYNQTKLVDTDSSSFAYSEVTKQTGEDTGTYVGILSREKEVFVLIATFTPYKDFPIGPYFFAYMSDSENYNLSMDDLAEGRFNEDHYKDSPAFAVLENAEPPVIVGGDETPLPTNEPVETVVPTEPPVVGAGPTFVEYHLWFTTLVPDTTIDQAKAVLQTDCTQSDNQYTFVYGADKIVLTYSDGRLISKILNYSADMTGMKMPGVTAAKLKSAKAMAKGKTYEEIKNTAGAHAYLISQTWTPEYSLTNMWVAEDGTTLTCRYDGSGKCISVE